jgi:hypothetical protein
MQPRRQAAAPVCRLLLQFVEIIALFRHLSASKARLGSIAERCLPVFAVEYARESWGADVGGPGGQRIVGSISDEWEGHTVMSGKVAT